MNECRAWSEGDPILEEYHDHEWCKINHDDDFQFMMLCLEGASVGLSWATIMHKKHAYCAAFHDFKIDACAAMTDEELEAQRSNPGIIRNRNKIFSVRKNAQVVQQIQKEFGSFDAYLWSFVDGKQIDGHWKTPAEVPTVSDISIAMSKDMKKRGIGFVGPVITYSFLQSIGIVNDHLADCEYRCPPKGSDRRNQMPEFKDKVAVVTGGAKGIGRCIAEMFSAEGAKVCIIDVLPKPHDAADFYFQGDISDPDVLITFAAQVLERYGHVDYLVNNALPLFKGIDDCTYEEFNYALRVGVSAPFMLTKLYKDHFPSGSAIVNISSSRDRMSQPQSESYTAAKGGIAALTHALAVSIGPRVRVNSVSPGWIETGSAVYEGPDALQQPAGRVGKPEDIANMVLFLCSEKAGFITGEDICIDGGMTKLMIYHDDHGWNYDPEG